MKEAHYIDPEIQVQPHELLWEYPRSYETCKKIGMPAVAVRDVHSDFIKAATDISLADVAVPYLDTKPIPKRTLDQATLTAVVSQDDEVGRICPQFAGYGFARPGTTRGSVALDDPLIPLDFYMDGHMGVILAKDDRPIACASGSLTARGPIIDQIQGLRLPDEEKLPSLRLLNWKLTVVTALIELWHKSLPDSLPYMQGKPIFVRAAMNNRWATEPDLLQSSEVTQVSEVSLLMRGRTLARGVTPEKYKRFVHMYDDTAVGLGACATDLYGNYILPEQYDIPTATDDDFGSAHVGEPVTVGRGILP